MPSKTFKRKNVNSKINKSKSLKRNSKSKSCSKKMRSKTRKMEGGGSINTRLIIGYNDNGIPIREGPEPAEITAEKKRLAEEFVKSQKPYNGPSQLTNIYKRLPRDPKDIFGSYSSPSTSIVPVKAPQAQKSKNFLSKLKFWGNKQTIDPPKTKF